MDIAVAHYPEGAGHATRMLAVARELESRGASVSLAGGGPGKRFIERLGYEEYVPERVDFVDDFQGQGGSLWTVCTRSIPASARRARDYVRWLRRVDPDALVTDDMFAAMAAPVAGVPLFVATHNAPSLYREFAERAGAAALTLLQTALARAFYFPAVWPPGDADPRGVERVPPIALDCPATAVEADVVLVPSTYSAALDRAADRLDEQGYDVARVGGPDWPGVDSMLPTLRAADCVVCAGYSTVMEAAVAGTPCVVYPHTSEQRGVARLLADAPGFTLAWSVEEISEAVADPPAAMERENGAPVVAERVLAALS